MKNKVIKSRKATLKTFIAGLVGVVALTSIINLKGCNNEIEDNQISYEREYEEESFDVEEILEEEKEVIEEDEKLEEIDEAEEEITSSDIIESESDFDYGSVVILNYDGYSIVEGLMLNGYDSSFTFRKNLATYYGIENYTGTVEQNLKLLNILRKNIKENKEETIEEIKNINNNSLDNNSNNLNDSKKEDNVSELDDHSKPQSQPSKHEHKWSKWNALNSELESRSCSCGKTQTRKHSYGKWIDSENNTLKRECKTCGYVETKEKDHVHQFGEWHYFDDTYEERVCECNHRETRKHTFGNVETEYIDNLDGTHQIKLIKHCNTCDKDIVISNRSDACTFGSWVYDKTLDNEKRVCDKCGHTETRKHVHSDAPDDLEYKNPVSLENGLHRLTASYTCEICEKLVTLTKDDNCTFGSWEKEDNYHKRECSVCHYKEEGLHYPSSDGVSIVLSDKEDYHLETYTCGECNHEISSSVLCTSDNSTNYQNNDGVVIEYSLCTKCHDKCNVRSHSHNFGTWTYKDEENEVRTCSCGYGEEIRAHNYGEWIYDEEKNIYVKTCSGCSHELTKEHTHSYGGETQVESTNPDMCYDLLSTCDCGSELRVPVPHDLTIETYFGVQYEVCKNCTYEKEIGTANLNTVTEETYNTAVASLFESDEIKEIIYKEEKEELENNNDDTKVLNLIP